MIRINIGSAGPSLESAVPRLAALTPMNAVSENAVSILLADDQPMVRLGVRRAIASQADLTICCETETMDAALVIVRTSRVDLAIVELSLGTDDGLELIRRLRAIRPSLPILVYSLVASVPINETFKAGLMPGLLVMVVLGVYSAYVG